jgi:hypothetical protein
MTPSSEIGRASAGQPVSLFIRHHHRSKKIPTWRPSAISSYSESMTSDRSESDRTAASVVALLRRGCWAAVPIGTIESLIAGGRVVDFPPGGTVYVEADAERLAVMLHGLLRVYMHAETAARSPCATFEPAISWVCRQ